MRQWPVTPPPPPPPPPPPRHNPPPRPPPPPALTHALTTLDQSDFYNPAHRTVFDACAHLEAAGRPVDPVTVAAHLHAAGQLQDLGGATVLHTLVESVPTVAHHAHYAQLVAATAAQ